MCAALIERKWRSAHSRRFAACLLDRTPPWWFMYETTDMLSVRISTCRCSSCGRKSLELRTLLPAPSSLCATGSEVLTTALKSACPRPLLTGLQSMRDHDTWCHQAQGNPCLRTRAFRGNVRDCATQLKQGGLHLDWGAYPHSITLSNQHEILGIVVPRAQELT